MYACPHTRTRTMYMCALQGLAVSRSIGDSDADHIGVIPDPDVTVHKITKDDKFLLWCSDGECVACVEAQACAFA